MKKLWKIIKITATSTLIPISFFTSTSWVAAQLSVSAGRGQLQNGTYQINNSQTGVFEAISQKLEDGTTTALPSDPVYIRIDNGWKGFYASNAEFVEYSLVGDAIKLQDAYHILLRPDLGLMVTFADKKEFGVGTDLLESHRQWEIEYWRKNASRVESANRDDLSGARRDLKVTELTLYNQEGAQLKSYMIGVALKDGVFVFSISPANRSIDPLVRKFVRSIKVVNKRLDIQEEANRIKLEAGKKQ